MDALLLRSKKVVSLPAFEETRVLMSHGVASIVRSFTACILVLAVLMLSAGSASAHAGDHANPLPLASPGQAITEAVSLPSFPSDTPLSSECSGGNGCCLLGQCPLQNATLEEAVSFDAEYRIVRGSYPLRIDAYPTGVAANPVTPPPRICI